MDLRFAGSFPVRRAMLVSRDDAPKVNGSEGAFVAIIVVLAVIVLAACTGIFFLLRYWDPTDRERGARRRFSIRRHGAPQSHPLPMGLRDPVAAGSLSEKLGNMFRGRRQGSGWHVAPDDDDWASGDEEVAQRHGERTSVGHAPPPMRRTIVEPDVVFSPPGHASPFDSNTPAAADHYPNPFEPPTNPFTRGVDGTRHLQAVAPSGSHFKEDV